LTTLEFEKNVSDTGVVSETNKEKTAYLKAKEKHFGKAKE